MELRILNDIIIFFVAILISGLIIPEILHIAFHKELFDNVDERKIHKGGVPRLGGIAFFPTILLSFSIVAGFNLRFSQVSHIYLNSEILMPFSFLICAVLLMFIVGIADDLIGVRYVAKFAMQIIAAVLIIFSGVSIENFWGFLWIESVPGWIGWLATGFMVVYVVNAINLIDGIDGLASGLSAVAFIFYAIIFYFAGMYALSMLAAAGAGTLLPFIYYNVFGDASKKKKIFMGDTGALTIGMLLIFCGIEILNIENVTFTSDFNPVILGISPLIIPLFDAVRVYFNRLAKGRNPFLPDKSHIHHKLLALGLNQRMALTVIMLWTMFFIVINLLLSGYLNPTFIIMGDIVIWGAVNLVLSKSIARKEVRQGKTLFE